MIAVMGASGNTGGRIGEQLLQQGEKTRALGRSSQRLAGLERKGADCALAMTQQMRHS